MGVEFRDLVSPFRTVQAHLFGDSHHALYKSLPHVTAHHLGPVTMHRVGRDGAALFGFGERGVDEGDVLGFIFGEIDVRVHLAPQIVRQKLPEQIVMAKLVRHYFRTLAEVRRLFPRSRIVVFSATPPAGFDYPLFDPNHPRNGTDEQRARWARWLNRALRSQARAAGYGFVDQYSMFANALGLLDVAATDDYCHIRGDLIDRVDTRPIFGGDGHGSAAVPADDYGWDPAARRLPAALMNDHTSLEKGGVRSPSHSGILS